jgi:hypothetical protein
MVAAQGRQADVMCRGGDGANIKALRARRSALRLVHLNVGF